MNMTNQLLGVKSALDTMAAQIATLQSQVLALQNMAFEIDSDNNFIPPLVEIEDEEDSGGSGSGN